MRRAVVGLVLVAACGSSSTPSGAPSQGASVGEPWAARAICEAECRRQQRCRPTSDVPGCFARCAGMPPRNPPAWRRDFVGMVVGCMDRSTCATDDDERCVMVNIASSPPSNAVRACQARGTGKECVVLGGLEPSADAYFAQCYASGGACRPPLDWK